MKTRIEDNEFWYGGIAHLGHLMPVGHDSDLVLDPDGRDALDQCAPVYVSTAGRYLWSEAPFVLRARDWMLSAEGEKEVVLGETHGNLKESYLAVTGKYLKPTGRIPDAHFFTGPQYNTWIELKTDQSAEGILRYAQNMKNEGLPAGILMIDEGWQEEYGTFEFNRRKIPDPVQLITRLHDLGYSVMLWVTPLISCAGPLFLKLRENGMLLRNSDGQIAIREWWNGFSAILDLTAPNAGNWFRSQLNRLMNEYGVDGFKFDAGDPYFYRQDDRSYTPGTPQDQEQAYNRLGGGYALNEFRAAWNCGGQPVVCRLQDKWHSWDQSGLNTLIPNTLVQGLTGHVWCCPDMVGGGDSGSFGEDFHPDEELFVRWAQANACMGMMQLSVNPFRILSAENAARVKEAILLHCSLGTYILEAAQHAAVTGEPLVRPLAYVFPGEGFDNVTDRFMLGDRLLVCPILHKGITSVEIRLPRGMWRSWKNEEITGGEIYRSEVTLDDLPRFIRI